MTRAEHLKWCKGRALEYVARGNLVEAVTSMGSDLTKHPETEGCTKGAMGMLFLLAAQQAAEGDSAAVKRYIEGFN